jgi:hypothetical protein
MIDGSGPNLHSFLKEHDDEHQPNGQEADDYA